MVWPAPNVACLFCGLPLGWPTPCEAFPWHGLTLSGPVYYLIFSYSGINLFFNFFFCRDEGIVIAVTIWQWIAELVVTILGGIISVNHGENRIVDHFMLFSIIWIVHVVLPAFFLLADSQFRRALQEKGFIRAIIEALTQEYQWKC